MTELTVQERQQQAIARFNGFRAQLAQDLGINLLIGQGSIGPFQTPNGLRTEVTAGFMFDVVQGWTPPFPPEPPRAPVDDIMAVRNGRVTVEH